MRQFFIILISLTSIAQNRLEGKLTIDKKYYDIVAEKTKVFISESFNSKTIIDSVVVDKELKFKFEDIKQDSIFLYIEPRSYPYNIFYDYKFNITKSQFAEIPYQPVCPYSKNNIFCPKCNKNDKSIPIIYGLVLIKRLKSKKYHLGGCLTTDCDPIWYCKRDKVEY